MTNYKVEYHEEDKTVAVKLPLSKSESNRLLLIAAIAGVPLNELKVSDCDDTEAMMKGLSANDNYVNVGAAGTAMRFLTAYFSNNVHGGTITIDGTERMRKRPIAPLVSALHRMGASIEYLCEEGFPPLLIKGRELNGGRVEMDASVSSQYISALMMIAPTFREPLEIIFDTKPVSMPYIRMTASMMDRCGAVVEVNNKSVKVLPGTYHLSELSVEPDWSAASYWYELAAISGRSVLLEGLKEKSLQGDSGIVGIFKQLGVRSSFDSKGVTISHCNPSSGKLIVDLEDMPDVAQTIAVTSALIGKPFLLTGLSTLPSKETDRLMALQKEFLKLGFKVKTTKDSIEWDGSLNEYPASAAIDTYKDHRMAMAFAPAAIIRENLIINDIEVVTKSYPDFWNDLAQFGFRYC